jgi:membrane protein involved in colicin uptake
MALAVLLALAGVGGLACGETDEPAGAEPAVTEDTRPAERAAEERAARAAAAQARRERIAARREARREARRARIRAERRAQRRAEREAALAAKRAAAAQPSCDPNYSGACLDPNAYDYDCAGGSGDGPEYTGAVQVVGSDPHDLDSDGDGYACE